MIETPKIIDISPARTTAVIRVCCPREELPCTMGRGVRELLDRIKAQGAQAMGPLFTHHLRGPTDSFDCEVGVAVDRPVRPAGHVCPGQWPAMRVARTLYRGHYEGLGRPARLDRGAGPGRHRRDVGVLHHRPRDRLGCQRLAHRALPAAVRQGRLMLFK